MATSGMFPRSSISGGSDEVHERVCSLCSKEGRVVDAIELCLDCEQYLCRPCSAHHGRFKALQAHNVVKKDQVPNLSLSVLTGSETIDFECTVCTVNGRYRAARVYCENCRKYLCSLCEKDHNLFALTRKHNMKSVEEIKKDVNKNLGKDNQYFAIEEKTVSAAKFSCVSCKREIDDVKRMWKCINCGFSNRCRGCCDQHQSSDKDHRIIPFHEFKVIYEQYGKAVMSGSGEFMGPVCSKCSMNGLAMYPSMFCIECKIFVCKLCQEEHNSHRTEKDDPVKRMHTDEIQQMTNIDHDCNVCMDINLRSSAEGYCTSCDVFICNGCIKLHTIYFGRESHIIQGLREINVRKKVFFDKTLYGAVEIGNLPCSFCRKKRIYSFAMCSCSDCKKDLCILCLDFHEIANVEHNLKFLRIHGEKEDSCEETELDQLQPKPRQAVEFNPIPSKLLLAAIDFGSLRSGYTSIVYSLSRTLKEGKFNKMHIIQIEETCVSENSSCLLFDADQRLSYFGEEAMTKYKEFQIKGEADRWYFFEQYDKCLLDTKVSYKTKLFSANGKSMRAGNVFEALMIHLITTMLILVPELSQASDIQLVCLVADEVSETCQSMLQNAAAKAGLDKNFVTSVSKATCIIKYCDLYDLPESKLEGKFPENFWETEKLFLVAVLGYDQNEVSVHKRLEDGTCRDIDRRYLGEWGFRKCVSECKEIFPEIFGHDVYNEFCDRDPDWLCEVTKKVSSFLSSSIFKSSTQKITFRLPPDLITLYEERTNKIFKEEVGKLPEHLRATTLNDKLRIDKSYFESVVASCIANNISLIKTVLTKHRFSKISTVIFFGTLLENQDIKEAMLGNFDGVVIDSDGGHTSSKAAVLYEFLKIRVICRFTYGINVCHDFYNEIHTKDHRLRMASRSISHEIHEIGTHRSDLCHNLFRRYFVRGEMINVGQIRYSRYTTIFPYQRKMVMYLLRSERREPKYADENGIEEFDVISVDLGRDVMHGQVEVRMVFTETYLLVEGFLVQKRNDDTEGTLKKVYAKKFPIIS